MSATHTLATLEVAPEAHDEIADKLRAAGYQHALLDEGGKLILDMTGIGLERRESGPKPGLLAIARDLYAAYCASSNGLNYQGLPCPTWDALTNAVRGHWYTVARRVQEPVPSVPGESLDHLPDPVTALATWRRYMGEGEPPPAT